ncbi:MAG: 1,4-dihydroxy-2-naphthoate octaprenyltransferase [Proteobacteria bacterium]|nr:1,4-dihydroxy-2-naphthoate octaprenyltransferase [Pseudomonadota bacterium]MBU4469239.1 1,4-dihydroxy-2-naphthoate octaprenyltransferase [Pseudomonadota bacterium]MCG2752270.1 1,4-dihydroxy-2-naphthoate octaprenyltransferase [Desulfobacteraceae bacterium]
MHAYRNWFLASRPWSFTMTAISVSVGGALAAIDGDFSWGYFLVTIFGAVILHAATNLINDYYDVKNGVDTQEAATAQYRPHPLVEGKLNSRQVAMVVFLLYGIAFGIGIFLVLVRGWELLIICLVGVLASILYTAPPVKYKYLALGEISVFLMWGPLMVLGAYFVQRQAFSMKAFWISIPFGILVALVILANNIRDIRHDQSKGISTLAIVLGQRKGLTLYFILILSAYLGIVLMSILGPLYLWSLIVLLSVPLALKLFRLMQKQIPIDADARTAQLDTAFGILLVLSLVLEGIC